MRKGHPQVLLLMYAHIYSQVFNFASFGSNSSMGWLGLCVGFGFMGSSERPVRAVMPH